MKKVLRLEAQLLEGLYDDYKKKKITRVLDVIDGGSLYTLARTILDSYDFAFDHAFGFYDDLDDPKEFYTLFADMEGLDDPDPGLSVKKSKTGKAFSEVGKTFLFHFDYGDDWIFRVKCVDISPRDEKKKYPVLISKTGKPPEQYPDYEEEE